MLEVAAPLFSFLEMPLTGRHLQHILVDALGLIVSEREREREENCCSLD